MKYNRELRVKLVSEILEIFPISEGFTAQYHAEHIIDRLDNLYNKANPEDKLTVEVGKSYINASGNIIEIVRMHRKGETRFGKVLREDTYETQNGGYKFASDGRVIGGLRHNRLMDRALAVQPGDVYDHHWPDGQSVGQYTVLNLEAKGYNIEWSNGSKMFIQYGCPLNYESVRVK